MTMFDVLLLIFVALIVLSQFLPEEKDDDRED